MTKSLLVGLRPVHPGTILRRDVLPALGVSVVAVAKALGLSRQHLYDIMNGRKPVTAGTALRLGRYLGNEPELWINLQSRYDLEVAKREMADALAAIQPAEWVAEAA
ncbi:MAG: HigA family addiction module antitoxin [Sphingomicrobium sp.]